MNEEKEGRAAYAREFRKKNRERLQKEGRARMGTGISDPNNIIFYGYKEPLRKFEGGYGYQGVLSYHKDTQKVQCHLCGLMFRALNNGHLGKVHGITAAEYKEKTGLKPSASLIGEETRLKLLERGYNPNHMEELKKCQQKRRKIIEKTGKDPQRHPKMSLEKKNERGTCPDQLLDIIEKTINSYGKVPTAEEFLSFHGGKYMGSIRATYGTWTNALLKLGHRTNAPRYTREQIIGDVKNFYNVHKRTPKWSDFERGFLPSANVVYRHFKGLNHLRLESGVPILIPVGKKRQEWMPSDKEKNLMIKNYL